MRTGFLHEHPAPGDLILVEINAQIYAYQAEIDRENSQGSFKVEKINIRVVRKHLHHDKKTVLCFMDHRLRTAAR